MNDNKKVENPFAEYLENRCCDITATEFEKYSLEILKAYAQKEGLCDFSITHDKKIKAPDGTYQIDVYATFTALNCVFKVIAECKMHKNSIERKVVAELNDKLKSIGAHKGIVISTAGFQKGAVEYAKAHGIALIQIFDKFLHFYSASANSDREKMMAIEYKYYPDYFAKEIVEYGVPLFTIYPTAGMRKEIAQKVKDEWKKESSMNGE